MISRWWLVLLDLFIGDRLGGLFAARDGFYAIRTGQRSKLKQCRFDDAHAAIKDALVIQAPVGPWKMICFNTITMEANNMYLPLFTRWRAIESRP